MQEAQIGPGVRLGWRQLKFEDGSWVPLTVKHTMLLSFLHRAGREGMPGRVLAANMGVSRGSLKVHVYNVREKLHPWGIKIESAMGPGGFYRLGKFPE